MGRWKEVFVFVIGTSPQIITETIYALSQKKPAVVPDEVFILTTSVGREHIQKSLIEKDVISQLIKEYGLPDIELKAENILIPKKKDGTDLDDICSAEDNELMGDLIISFIREKCLNDGTRLHCSLAGGRKTMSFYLGAALQMFGRPWDKLYHVIVSPEFESNPDFFYKPRISREISVKTREGREIFISTRQAKIMLAELPFVRLGRKLNLRSKTFKELVEESQKEIDLLARQPEVLVDRRARRLMVEEKEIPLRPMMLFVYLLFALAKKQNCAHPEKPYCLDCVDCYKELNEILGYENLKQHAEDLSKILRHSEYLYNKFFDRWKVGLSADVGRQYISKINKAIKLALNNEFLSSRACISALKIYAGSRYGLRIEKSKININ